MKIDLKKKLNDNSQINSWQYNRKDNESYQIYLAKEKIECIRKVESEQIEVIIYRQLKDGRIGEASFYFTPVEEFQIDEKIEKALYIAGLTAQKPFKIAGPVEYEKIPILDEGLFKNPLEILEQFRERIIGSVNKEPALELSSSECYIYKSSIEFANSRGCEGKTQKSRISWDFVLLSGENLESESWYETSCCHRDQLNIEEKIAEYANYARDNVKTTLPKTIKTAVVINAKSLLPFFNPLLSHSSGQFIYEKISSLKKGENIFRGENLIGDGLYLYSNPCLPYGLKSSPFDSDGVASRRTEIIKNSKLENIWATKRYGSYLNIQPTGRLSNLEVIPGNTSMENLLKTEDKPIYYIVNFSLLIPDVVSGDFATEIRFGYEITPFGEKIPIKGGSVSGNVFELFSNAKFSNNQVREDNYLGPDAIRFEQVSIAGS